MTAIEIMNAAGEWSRLPGTSTFTDEDAYHDIDIESFHNALPPAIRESLSEAREHKTAVRVRLREFGTLKACTIPLEGFVEGLRESELHSIGQSVIHTRIRMPIDDFWREDF